MLLSATRPDPDGAGGNPALAYSFTYNSIGKVLNAVDPVMTTTNAYAANGNLNSTTLDPGASPHIASVTSFTYDAQGDVLTLTDPRGNVTESVYDLARRKTQDKHHNGNIAAALNAAAKTTYDVVGRVTKTEAGTVFSGTTVTTWTMTNEKTYTPTSKVLTDKDGDNRVTTTAYDGLDRVLSVTDPVGRVTRLTYDAAGQTLIEQRAFGTALQQDYATYTYTANGKQASVKDALGASHTTNFTYDGFDRLSRTTFPDATYEELTYDADGDVLTRRNRSAQVLTYTYDNLDRMLTKFMPGSPNETTTWAYDGAGKITNLSDTANNVLAYSFDTAGRVTQVATTLPVGSAKNISYQYDAASNRTRLTWPDGYYVVYAYDTLNRMTSASENGATTLAAYAYNPLSQRTSVAYMAASDTMTYSYSTAGDMLTLAHNLGGTTNDNAYTFTYTNAHQVASDAASVAGWKWQSAVTGTTAYGVANNLNQYPSVGGTNFTYDTRGNLTSDGVWTYGYDAENMMLTASRTGPIVNATFAYDPLGRRVKKSTGGGAATTYYVSDGADEIAEYTGFTANTLQRRYVPGPAIDQPIAMVTSAGVRTFFHTDKRGSVIATSDSAGNLAEGLFTYDACGNMSGATTGEPFRYAGRRYDSETGLLFNRARYLSNALCRFLQTDPVGNEPNAYIYADNDPTNMLDSDGQRSIVIGDKIFIRPENASILVPSPIPNTVGARGVLSSDFSFHTYLVAGDSGIRDSRAFSRALANNPTPGHDHPASPSGTLNDVGTAFRSGNYDIGSNYVRSFTVPSPDPHKYTDMVVNYTVSGKHELDEGFVILYGLKGKSGSITPMFYGEGNALLQNEALKRAWYPFVNPSH
jgi:RHS repeat-associated protein